MKISGIILTLLVGVLLCSCDDGHQRYSQMKVEGDKYFIYKLESADSAAFNTPVSNIDATDYGKKYTLANDNVVYELNQGTIYTIYKDEDWGGDPSNLFIIDGEVVDQSVFDPAKYDNYPEGLSKVQSGDLTESDLRFSAYYDLLKEVCPPKAKARSMFFWITVCGLIGFIIMIIGAFALDSDDESNADGNKTSAIARSVLHPRTIGAWVLAILFMLLFIGFPTAVYMYFYLNPQESLWFINDWGFIGFFVGCFILFVTLTSACMPLMFVSDGVKKLFSGNFKEGAGWLILGLALCVVSYFFLPMVLGQIWDQCGFLIKSLGVLILVVMIPGSLSGKMFSTGDSSPDSVSDGNGNTHYVSSSENGGSTIHTTDGKTMYRTADGNYRPRD